jgi:ribosome maturation factor RimP
MRPNPLAEKIEQIITPTLAGMGFAVVMLRMTEAHKRRTLQLFIEHSDGRGVNLDDCAQVSGVVSALLDVQDPIDSRYDLEVSSPGIDRPLVKLADFARYAGHQARVDLAAPLDGRKRFSGTLLAVEGEEVKLRTADGKEYFLPYGQMAQAKLILTDELIKAHAKVAKPAAGADEDAGEGFDMPLPVNDNAMAN